jgi:hypothetical protein
MHADLPTPVLPNAATTVVLLSDPICAPDLDDVDLDGCIGSAMRDANPDVRVVPARLFREQLYPYFMPSTTPHTLEDYTAIFEQAEVQKRLAALDIRYLIVMIKSEVVTDWHGGIFCGAGYGGGGCLGLSWWDRTSDMGFAIWDLQSKAFAGTIRAKAGGRGIMPALILPIPVYVPATKSAVCRDIGTHLSHALSGQP